MAPQISRADIAGLIPAAALRAVPGCESGTPPLELRVLPGGLANHSLRIDTIAGSYVLRLPRTPAAPPGVDRRRELAFQQAAAAAGIAPRVLAAGADTSWLLMEFVTGAEWQRSELAAPGALQRLGGRLAELQHVAPPEVPMLDVGVIVRGQVALILQREPDAVAELQILAAQAQQFAAEGAVTAGPLVINHGDLNVANLLGPGPCLVDWEYAQLASPLYDIACLLTYYPEIEPRLDGLLGALGLGGPDIRAALRAQCALFGVLDQLWRRAQLP